MTILQGQKCRLCRVTSDDAYSISVWENNPEHWLVSDTVSPYSMDEILEFISNSNNLFVNKQTRMMIWNNVHECVGCIDLYDFDVKNKRAGVGVLIDPGHRARGYASDALRTLTNYCFDELELHQVYAEVPSNNKSSVHLFESCGFSRTGHKVDWLRNINTYVDVFFYQLTCNK